MKKQLMTGLFTVLALTAGAQTFQEWRNPEINAVNRAPMHTNYFAFENADAAKKANKKQSTNYMTLNGTWKFNWVKDADSRPTDFWKTGFNDKGWDDLQVPAVWELNGYGDPIYVNVGYAWRNQFQNNPPEVPTENNHVGSYRREIVVPASWNGKDIIAHFGSVTSNMYLWVNGRYVGYSEDSKLEAEFDLTPYLKPGQKNLIAFQVFRWCDGSYLEDQDFFRYSGVGRDCYLYARNKKRIQDIRVTPDLDAAYQNGSLAINLDLKGSGKVDLELVDAQGKQVATATANKSGLITMNVENPKKWSAETPYLYTLRASMQGSNEVIPVRVGFRKIELKGDQILVNGKAVLFKGADRHEMDPDGGYVVSPERMLQDIQIMKQFNLNAVRTCHYPDDNLWYDLCDQYGIYVVAEANIESHGMGYGDKTLAKNPSYKKAHLERNQRNVQRGFNHPSIIFWSLGNEAGDGPNFEQCYQWIKAEDPSRACQYEQARQKDHTDIFCPMYYGYEGMEKYGQRTDATKPLIQCYLEDQDFFRYSGVGRDCYLYARNKKRIQDIRVTPDLDAAYQNGSLAINLDLKGSGKVDLELVDAQGKQVATATANKSGLITMNVENPKKWSAETPYLYTLRASMQGSNEVIPVRVGFRKIELKGDQILVNGKAVLFKGADRHEMDPDGGYVVSPERMLQDIQIMKQFNLNAVRTCHYPDDNLWYDLCDQYGIYVVAEANIESHGMGYGDKTLAKNPSYKKAHLERNQRNVQRGFNHPSIIFWSLGNEAGDGPNFEQCYQWIKAEDPSRACQYEQARQKDHTDIFCPMYYGYEGMEKYGQRTDATKPLIQCEYAHAMGNSQGGFKEYWDLIRKYPNLQGGFIWDFVDQSCRWKGKDGVMIYAYGGDFNRFDASDNNFCDNGLISPDRVPNPHMYEVGYFYQNIWTTPSDLSKGEVNVFNENFFRDLSAYYMEWQVLKDGKIIRTGRVDDLKIAPQETAKITLNIGKTCTCKEWLLNVSYKLKNREGLLPAGFTVAKNQLTLNDYKAPSMDLKNVETTNVATVVPQIIDNQYHYLIVKGNNFVAEFNKQNGYLSKYAVDGTEMLKEGAALTPNFWRAPTDNDMGAGLQNKYAAWKNPGLKLISLNSKTENDQIVVNAEYDMKNVSAKLYLTYVINNEGAIKVTQKMTADKNATVSPMFRFGMQMQMPKCFETVEYYGRGPVENYSDRNHSTDLGIYRQSVNEQFYSYIRPQETGTKTDIRWWKQLNAGGNGLKVVGDAPFSASALHYTICSLDDGEQKDQRHSPEVQKADLTNLIIDKAQMGLGCVNSWGALPLPQYMLPYGDYEFTFILTPVKHQIEIE